MFAKSTFTIAVVAALAAICTSAPTTATTSADVPIVINLGLDANVQSYDCPPETKTGNKLFAGAPFHSSLGNPCGKEATLHYNGKTVTVTIAWEATGAGISDTYMELVPAAYEKLTGASYGGQVHGTCAGTCP